MNKFWWQTSKLYVPPPPHKKTSSNSNCHRHSSNILLKLLLLLCSWGGSNMCSASWEQCSCTSDELYSCSSSVLPLRHGCLNSRRTFTVFACLCGLRISLEKHFVLTEHDRFTPVIFSDWFVNRFKCARYIYSLFVCIYVLDVSFELQCVQIRYLKPKIM